MSRRFNVPKRTSAEGTTHFNMSCRIYIRVFSTKPQHHNFSTLQTSPLSPSFIGLTSTTDSTCCVGLSHHLIFCRIYRRASSTQRFDDPDPWAKTHGFVNVVLTGQNRPKSAPDLSSSDNHTSPSQRLQRSQRYQHGVQPYDPRYKHAWRSVGPKDTYFASANTLVTSLLSTS